jgi:hypothetical protein
MLLDYLYLQIIYARCKQIIEFHYITSLNSHKHAKKEVAARVYLCNKFIFNTVKIGKYTTNHTIIIPK